MEFHKRIIEWTGIFVFGVLLAGCGNFQGKQPSPEEILALASQQMASLEGFEFVVDRSGAPAFLDPQETIAFRRAEGSYTAPSRVYTKVRVIAPGLVAEVEIINIEGQQWETNLLTDKWQVSDTRYTFNPNLLFDPQTGIPYVLSGQLTDAALIKIEEIEEAPGIKLYVLAAGLAGESAYQMTYGLIDKDPLEVTVWVEPETFNVFRIRLTDPAMNGEGEPTIWQIDFWNFGGKFDIQKPILND